MWVSGYWGSMYFVGWGRRPPARSQKRRASPLHHVSASRLPLKLRTCSLHEHWSLDCCTVLLFTAMLCIHTCAVPCSWSFARASRATTTVIWPDIDPHTISTRRMDPSRGHSRLVAMFGFALWGQRAVAFDICVQPTNQRCTLKRDHQSTTACQRHQRRRPARLQTSHTRHHPP